ncbi:MAG: MCE family protein [Bacteroidales bacterium]|nr:MCE family protein [Bacteroidales bacterium]
MRMTIQKSIRLGVFIIVGIAIFAYAIYIIGKQRNLFGNTFTVSGIFKDVSGLKVGSNVRYSGINVGTVSTIKLVNDTLVRVQATLENKVHPFIREDSRMEIGTEGVMGNKVVNITPGSSTQPVVDEGDVLGTIEAVKIDEILEQLERSSINTTRVTKNLAEITSKINQGEGIFGKLFTDTSFTNNLDEISRNTAQLTRNFSTISGNINKEEGVIGKLLSDTTLANEFDQSGHNLLESTRELKKITEKINQGGGLFGKMFTDTAFTRSLGNSAKNLEYTTRQAKTISENLANITQQMESGRGVINKLLTDSVFSDSLDGTLKNINRSAKELDQAAETLRKNWFIRTFSSKKQEQEQPEGEEAENQQENRGPENQEK